MDVREAYLAGQEIKARMKEAEWKKTLATRCAWFLGLFGLGVCLMLMRVTSIGGS